MPRLSRPNARMPRRAFSDSSLHHSSWATETARRSNTPFVQRIHHTNTGQSNQASSVDTQTSLTLDHQQLCELYKRQAKFEDEIAMLQLKLSQIQDKYDEHKREEDANNMLWGANTWRAIVVTTMSGFLTKASQKL